MTNPTPREQAIRQQADLLLKAATGSASQLANFVQDLLDLLDQLRAEGQPPLQRIPEEWAEAANAARGLCESEANRWETQSPKTSEHWRSVAIRLGALYLTADHLAADADVATLRQQLAQAQQERDRLIAALEGEKLEHQETRGTVAAWKQEHRRAIAALEEVAHHADDECGFMVNVRAALVALPMPSTKP